MLAVQVDYRRRLATIGTERGRAAPRQEILEALKSIGYTGEFLDESSPDAGGIGGKN